MSKLLSSLLLSVSLLILEQNFLAMVFIPYVFLAKGAAELSLTESATGGVVFAIFIAAQRIVNFNLAFTFVSAIIYLKSHVLGEKLWKLSALNLTSSVLAFCVLVYKYPYKIDLLLPSDSVAIPPIYIIFISTLFSPYILYSLKSKLGLKVSS